VSPAASIGPLRLPWVSVLVQRLQSGCGVRLGFCYRPMWGRRPRSIVRWSSTRACPVRPNAPVRVSRETGSVCRLDSLQHAGDFLVSRSRPLEVGGRNSRGAVRLMRGPSRCTNTQDRRVDPCELCLRLSAREMRGRGELGQRASLRLRRDSQFSPWVIQGRFSAYRELLPCSARAAAWFGSHCCPVGLGLESRRGGDASVSK
jgi:hypothetical protein